MNTLMFVRVPYRTTKRLQRWMRGAVPRDAVLWERKSERKGAGERKKGLIYYRWGQESSLCE